MDGFLLVDENGLWSFWIRFLDNFIYCAVGLGDILNNHDIFTMILLTIYIYLSNIEVISMSF